MLILMILTLDASQGKPAIESWLPATVASSTDIIAPMGGPQDTPTIEPWPPATVASSTDTICSSSVIALKGKPQDAPANDLTRQPSIPMSTLLPIQYSPASPTKSPTQISLTGGTPHDEDPAATVSNKGNSPSCPSYDKQTTTVCNPLSTIAEAALKAKITAPQLPPPPPPLQSITKADPTSAKGTTDTPGTDMPGPSSKHKSGSSKGLTKVLHPSSTKNGQYMICFKSSDMLNTIRSNLCGNKDEYHEYYDRNLTKQQCKDYNKEAKELTEKNLWVKAVIEKGMLH
ncbi:hypothetical protein BKA82DRAFT_8332 [Pisolithus tinctorius]|uniref:Uncharacterized protein n=1 Tax=Pisolithus tinctorius Marx 270 TaxID=870435 RepID=A0A0C3P4M6_PISTI|nr:hypothetical protein BKA82DRAFT_8332 [Pisolithus tinctorius]KIO08010.1 hypothetical protein M404DRAFT_8332 [Pisolithus tinctorius Marx 270]